MRRGSAAIGGAVLLALAACGERPASSLTGFVPAQAGALQLQVPAAWPRLPDKGATATWLVPGSGAGDGSLAVEPLAGGVERELARWRQAFAPEGLEARPSTMRFPGRQAMEVLELRGTWRGEGGTHQQAPDWKTIVAAITLSTGAWSARIAGPTATVDRALTDFHTVLGQIRD
jgi:hypothetical protein